VNNWSTSSYEDYATCVSSQAPVLSTSQWQRMANNDLNLFSERNKKREQAQARAALDEQYQQRSQAQSQLPKRKGGMLSDLFGDLRSYVKDNRDLIFSVVFILVLDEYVFNGAFRERLKGVIEGVLKKVENKTGIDIPGV
jgi:hypothetical protein